MAIDEGADWSDLPKELWSMIGKTLNTRIDVLRFRSVCKSWRYSLPPSDPNLPPFSSKIPYSLNSDWVRHLLHVTVYLFQHPGTITGASTSSTSSSLSSNGWLIKVEESNTTPMRVLSPFCNRPFRDPPITFPKTLNLLDYRVVELCKSYSLKYKNDYSSASIQKIVLFPTTCSTDVFESVIFSLDDGELGYMKHGDEKWTLVDDRKFYYDDLVFYKGQVSVVDRWGATYEIDVSSLKLTEFSSCLRESGNQKRLVESCGSLYVVDKYYDRDPRRGRGRGRRRRQPHGMLVTDKVVNFKVYKLDEELGICVEVKNLGDRTFVLGDDCSFSVLSKEFAGCQENAIYFRDIFGCRAYILDQQLIFTPEDLPGSTEWLWPPPTWFRSHPSCSYTLGVE